MENPHLKLEPNFCSPLCQIEKRFLRIFNASPNLIAVSQISDNRFIELNDAFLQLTGYKKEEITGHSLEELCIIDPNTYNRIYQKTLQYGKLNNIEVSLHIKSGERLIGLLSTGLVDLQGELCILYIINDITASQEALQKSEENFRQLVENLSDWIWEVDEKRCFSYSSPQVFNFLAYHPQEIIGKSAFELMPVYEKERVADLLSNIQLSDQASNLFENILIHKDGHLVFMENSVRAIFDSSRVFQGYRGVCRNISQRKYLEEELRKHNEQLEELVIERTAELAKANQCLREQIIKLTKAEKNLRNSQAYLRRLTDNMLDMISQINTEGKIEYVSPSCQKILGYEPEELLGKAAWQLTGTTNPPLPVAA